MPISKVVYGATTLVDLTADTVTAAKLAEGATAHDAAGNAITGTAVIGSGEISITENGTFDVKRYASAKVNVVSEPVLLWTNASPTSAFGVQQVSFDGAGYNFFIVEGRNSTSDALVGYGLTAYMVFSVFGMYNGSYLTSGQRSFTYNGSGIYFLDARRLDSSDTDNSLAIPTRIWGANFTL